MRFRNEGAEVFIPDSKLPEEGIARTTHMAVAAHQDDIEIMAYHGIQECFGNNEAWFTGVTLTNGADSPRNGIYEDCNGEEMSNVRRLEQKKAAFICLSLNVSSLGFLSVCTIMSNHLLFMAAAYRTCSAVPDTYVFVQMIFIR